jgi:hypothetical protein
MTVKQIKEVAVSNIYAIDELDKDFCLSVARDARNKFRVKNSSQGEDDMPRGFMREDEPPALDCIIV